MPPKRAKSGAGSAGPQKWEQALVSTPFIDEGSWNAAVVWLTGNKVEDYAHINTLAASVNAGARKLFSHVTKDELYDMVNELGNPKNKGKVKEVPANSEICEPCRNYLENGEDIPLPLLAKLVKFRLLDVKQKDLKRRESDKKAPAAAAGADKGGKGGKGGKADKDRAKSPGKGSKGGKKTPEPPSPKGDTKMRRRGDEDTDSKYIDDEPDDGPEHYVFVSGFHQPLLIPLLAELGVNVDAIIKVISDDYEVLQPPPATATETEPPSEEKLQADEEARQKAVKSRKELKVFWRDTIAQLQKAPEGSKLHDLARLEYIVKTEKMPENPEDVEQKSEFGLALFEDTACMVYDLLDARRQWQNFLVNLHLLHVPVIGGTDASQAVHDNQSQQSATPAPQAATTLAPPLGLGEAEPGAPPQPEIDLRFYNELMDTVPQESASVPLVLHAMLEQVVAWEEDKEPPSETPRPPRPDGLDEGLSDHITNASFKLALTNEEINALASELNTNKVTESGPKQPMLIDHNDKIAWRLNHLKPLNGFDHQKVEDEMLVRFPLMSALRLPRPSAKATRERAARLQELLHFCSSAALSQAEVDHAFKQFVFENMEQTAVDESGAVICAQGTKGVIPWDDPYSLFTNQPEEEEELQVEEVKPDPGPVEPAKLAQQLEALQPKADQPTPSPPPRPASATSGRSSRSRGKKKRSKSPTAQATPVAASPVPPPEEKSRPNSSGILKSRSRSASRSNPASRRSSVHFERDENGEQLLAQPGDDTAPPAPPAETPRTVEEMMGTVLGGQQRNVDQWCFAEHFEPNVLKQVLREAAYTHPYLDTYYHRRDHTLFVVLHNPYNSALHSTVSWQTNLHSNVGFRNYLEHVAAAIEDWTRVEEAKYEAEQLAHEVDRIQREADANASRPNSGAGGKKGRERSKSPKKAASRTGRSSSRGSSGERPPSTNMFIREGSLKAQKMENDAQKAELEDQERLKSEKRARSASKKPTKEEEKKEKKSNSRSSSKSRISKEVLDTEPAVDAEPKEPEKQWPFMGYDVGNSMIHVGGTVTTMFPADGGQIRVNKTEFVQGTVGVSTAVLKDGHQFLVHVLDPRVNPEEGEDEEETEDGTEKADEEKNEKTEPEKPSVGRFGSLTACFNDGMSLAFSTYGPTGSPDEGKDSEEIDMLQEAKKEMLGPATLPTPRSPSPGPKAESPAKSRKDKGKTSTPEPVVTLEEELLEEEDVEEPLVPQPFQQMYLTCPDGLYVSFQLESALGIKPESEEQRRLTVRQLYPFKTSGQQTCESLRRTALEETSRLVTSEGVVIRSMVDGTTVLLYPDGKVSILQGLPPTGAASRPASPQRAGSAKSNTGAETPTKKGRSRKSAKVEEPTAEPVEEDASKKPQWLTTMPDGSRLANTIDGTKVETRDALVCMATDPNSKQVLTTREDHVMKVTHPDGTLVVEHADGTRITSYTREVEVQTNDDSHKETGESPQLENQEVRFVHVECPGFATVKFDTSTTECSVEFGTGTVVNAYPSGNYDVYHHDGGYLQAETDGTAVYTPRPNNDLEVHNPDLDMRYLFRHFAESVVETVDNEGNQFTVKHTGDTNVSLSATADVLRLEDQQREEDGGEKEAVKTQRVVHYKQHAPRFFIVHGDGSGTELLRYQDVAEYMAVAEDDPTTAILMDQLQDYPGVVGISIMKPQARGFSDQWLRSYSQQTVIPAGLTSRDLKTLPPREYKKEGPVFGTNVGQGLMVGSVVRSEPRPPVLKCPNILEVRQLLQYKPVTQNLRESLQGGLREYAKFVCTRQEESLGLLVQDPRTEAEKLTAANLAAAARVVSEANAKTMYEKTTATTLPEACPTPQPKRSRADWERDMREVEEEKDNLKTLRNHDVPKYFDSELGKAFLLAQAPDIDHLTKQLAAGTLRRSPQGQSETTTSPDNPNQDTSVNASQQSHVSDRSEIATSPEVGNQRRSVMDSPYIRDLGSTPSAVRPGNPTPAHAAGQGSPAPLRPKNPTPAHATSMALVVDRPGAPTPKEALRQVPSETPSSSHAPHVYPSIPEQPQEEKKAFVPRPPSKENLMEPFGTRTLHVNVVGAPRDEPVTVPAYISYNGRPNALSNERFSNVEDPVRRHIYTSSVAGASAQGAHTLSRMRGFELLPNYVDFGVLKEGNTYAFPVHLKNTGIDACRFRVKQPPPSTGLRVLFRPGPVAAGMKAELTLELYAIAVGVTGDSGVGSMEHNVEIVTETDHLYLPVHATILTAHEYDNRGKNTPQGGRNNGVKWVSNRPPAGQGIIRPRKNMAGTEMLTM